ncbi:MAG: hypothetical protein M3430_04730 [Acidobacteriota bacterium]|nr:hypothetical protein [Acidobacteriota bacterium]
MRDKLIRGRLDDKMTASLNVGDTLMAQSVLSQIEDSFSQLSVSEQRRLIERLVRRVHQNAPNEESDLDNQLALMAADPEIQSELRDIEREFAHAEADGLEAT